MLKLNLEIANELLQYLASKPYGEVHLLIQKLQSGEVIEEDKEEEEK